MREHRWETESPIDFQSFSAICNRLRKTGFKIREDDLERACYFDEFAVKRIDEVSRLSPWIIEELTLVELIKEWKGDFFLLAGRHHDVFREHERMEAYLSICRLCQIPLPSELRYHEPEAVFWIGFRDTHAFIRVRVVPTTIITPGEKEEEEIDSEAWLAERGLIFSHVISELELPIAVERETQAVKLFSTDSSALLSVTWPDTFGPCQFEFVVSDRYSLLVPASKFVSKFGIPGSTLRIFLSGFPLQHLEKFQELEPDSDLFYRGFIQAPLTDLPEILSALGPSGKGLINLCDFQTENFVSSGKNSEGVIGVIGELAGYKIEVRLNRSPFSKEKTKEWLERLTGSPMLYSPLPLF